MDQVTFSVELKRAEPVAEERLVYGYAYVATKADGTPPVDTDGDVVDTPEALAALKTAFWQYFKDHRTGDDMHVDFDVAELRDGIVLSPDVGWALLTPESAAVLKAAGIASPVPTGAFISLQIPTTPRGDALWDDVKAGKRRMLSIVATLNREPIGDA